ncbi:CBD9-like protein [Mycena floridula]|nr:CBD9-like protein [Mycena floridula]
MILISFLALCTLLGLVSGLERRDPLAGQNITVTGDKKCNSYMCIGAVLNGSTVTYTLSSTGKMTPGWMAIGSGSNMKGSSMVIMWSNFDGSITLSQRKATGKSEPTVDSDPSAVATLSTDLSTTSGSIQFVYTMPATDVTSEKIIYAFGGANPDDASIDASLREHTNKGSTTLDLTKPVSSDGSPVSTSIGQDYERLILVHAILCVIGFLLLLPAGALLARYLRTRSPSWFMGHWIAQFALSAPLIVAGFAIGFTVVSGSGETHLDDRHKTWGVVIFALYLAQCGLGALIHWVKPKRSTGRPPQNYVHAVLGLVIIGLALYQVRSGYNEEWGKATSSFNVPSAINIIWYIWVILLPLLYAVGLAYLPRQFRQEANGRCEGDDINMTTIPQKYEIE